MFDICAITGVIAQGKPLPIDFMIDLGTEPPDFSKTEPVSPERGKTRYPSFNLSDKVAEQFKKECGDCDVDQVYTACVKIKISGMTNNEYGKSITVDVLEMDEVEAEEKEEATETKPSKYKNPAVAKATGK